MQPVQVPAVAIENLPEKLPNADAIVLDVREDDEWQAGHAPDAVHIPLGELAGRLNELPADQDVFVVCRSGGRSARATAYLNQNGWDAVNVEGGMKAWALTDRPVVSESGNTAEIL